MVKRYLPIIFLIATIGLSGLFFRNSFNNFFFEDDFFHMVLANGQSLTRSFNILAPAQREYYIFRPLTTQLFWKLGQNFFGLNPFPYHMVNFLFFSINVFLVYILARKIDLTKRASLLASFVFALAGSNFYRLFFLSTFQEIVVTTFALLTMILYINKSRLAILTFVLALLSKETGIMIPFALAGFDFLIRKKVDWKVGIYFAISVLYFFLHKYFYGFYQGGIYAYDFNPVSTLNNYLWYLLWTIGLPEGFVNVGLKSVVNWSGTTEKYFGPLGLQIVGSFFSLSLFIFYSLIRFFANRKKMSYVLFFVFWWFVFLLPVAFFPFHKFAINVGTATVGFVLLVGQILNHRRASQIILAILFVVFLNLTIRFNEQTHWVVKRPQTVVKVMSLIKSLYPQGIDGRTLYFRNNVEKYCEIDVLEQRYSSEAAFALSHEDAFKIFYPGQNFKVYYEDLDQEVHCNRSVDIINLTRTMRDPLSP